MHIRYQKLYFPSCVTMDISNGEKQELISRFSKYCLSELLFTIHTYLEQLIIELKENQNNIKYQNYNRISYNTIYRYPCCSIIFQEINARLEFRNYTRFIITMVRYGARLIDHFPQRFAPLSEYLRFSYRQRHQVPSISVQFTFIGGIKT